MMSLSYSHLAILAALTISPAAALAAPAQESLAREYEQVRKIALRDPKVRAAYAAADQRLEDKIVSIDPALSAYVKSRGRSTAGATEKPAPASVNPPPAKPTRPKPTAQSTREITHVVGKGDTLSTIAAKYSVTVAELRKTNNIQDERKLPIGQTLTIRRAIPAGSTR